MKKIALTTLLLSLLLITSCSTAATLTPVPTSTPMPTVIPVTEAPQIVIEDTDVDVLIQELSLDPAEIVIHVGTKVTWFNFDATRHTVTANAGEFESPILLFGDTYSFTFDEPGEYPYSNKYHPDIKGRVVVVP